MPSKETNNQQNIFCYIFALSHFQYSYHLLIHTIFFLLIFLSTWIFLLQIDVENSTVLHVNWYIILQPHKEWFHFHIHYVVSWQKKLDSNNVIIIIIRVEYETWCLKHIWQKVKWFLIVYIWNINIKYRVSKRYSSIHSNDILHKLCKNDQNLFKTEKKMWNNNG